MNIFNNLFNELIEDILQPRIYDPDFSFSHFLVFSFSGSLVEWAPDFSFLSFSGSLIERAPNFCVCVWDVLDVLYFGLVFAFSFFH